VPEPVHYMAGGVLVVETPAEFDVWSGPDVRDFIHGLVSKGTRVLVADLRHAEYLGPVGMGVLIWAQNRLEENGGGLAVAADSDAALKPLRQSGLLKFLRVYATVDEAVAALSGKAKGSAA
jgi:anti-sigma B factor antagonist